MLVKPEKHSEKECMSTNSQYNKMDKSHQSLTTLKVKDITTEICCSQCLSGAHQDLNTQAHPGAEGLNWLEYSN